MRQVSHAIASFAARTTSNLLGLAHYTGEEGKEVGPSRDDGSLQCGVWAIGVEGPPCNGIVDNACHEATDLSCDIFHKVAW